MTVGLDDRVRIARFDTIVALNKLIEFRVDGEGSGYIFDFDRKGVAGRDEKAVDLEIVRSKGEPEIIEDHILLVSEKAHMIIH